MKASEERVMAEVDIMKITIEYIRSSAFVFRIDPTIVSPTSDPTLVSPTSDLAVDLP